MSLGLRIKLSVMMFLQYFVWGLWLPALYQRLGSNGLDLGNTRIAWISAAYGIGSIVAPFLVGQVADRYFATEKVMAFAHFFGGLLLIASAYATTFWPLFLLLLLYCSLYMPTMALSNSISFRSMGEGNQNSFPLIRMFGAIGWIAAGFFYAGYLNAGDLPSFRGFYGLSWVGPPTNRDCLRLAGFVSLFYGIYCLFLPHTPPTPVAVDSPSRLPGAKKRSAMLEVLGLLRDRSFASLIVVSGLIGIMLAFYFQQENPFLEAIGISVKDITMYMSFGQVAETLLIGLVPLSVAKFGVKNTMMIGAGAWALRFGISAIGTPKWLMISTIGLHGFCFGFFFVVAQMYVDKAAGEDIKASAQNFFVFVVYGLGTVIGNLLAGKIRDEFGTNWRMVWGFPFGLTLLCLVFFALCFRDRTATVHPVEGLATELA